MTKRREPPALIPALVNMRAGTAAESEAALKAASSRFAVRLIEPKDLAEAVRQAVASGAGRIAVAGGDGSIETAATVLAGSPVELAVIPGGTLNHFARAHGIPLTVSRAVEVAAVGSARPVDVGMANRRVFINTSSVGAYVAFVRAREVVRPVLGYHLASLVGGFRTFMRLSRFRVHLAVDHEEHVYDTPLLFVGVGERSLTPPNFGLPVPGGKRVLHVMVVDRPRDARRWVRAYRRSLRLGSSTRDTDKRQGPLLDAFLVDACRAELPRRSANVAVDGDITAMTPPLAYRLCPDALHVVGPRGGG